MSTGCGLAGIQLSMNVKTGSAKSNPVSISWGTVYRSRDSAAGKCVNVVVSRTFCFLSPPVNSSGSFVILYMAFQKGTQTAPHGGIMPPQAGISTAGNGNFGCAGRRLTVAGHGGIMNPLLLMYKTGQRWRAT